MPPSLPHLLLLFLVFVFWVLFSSPCWLSSKISDKRKWRWIAYLLFLQDVRNGSQALSRSSSNVSDSDVPRKKAEPAYSFVGMHCIFDQCKAMGNYFNDEEHCYLPLSLLSPFFSSNCKCQLLNEVTELCFPLSYCNKVWAHKFWYTCIWSIWWKLNSLQCHYPTFCYQAIDWAF